MTLCKCGCGNEITKQRRLYIDGHLIAWNKDKTGVYSKKTLEQMSLSAIKRLSIPQNHPMFGHQTFHISYNEWLINNKPKIYCQCGCTKEIIVKSYCKYDGIPNYIVGHNNFGKHYSEEIRQKISNGNKGKIVSEETKQKLSDVNKGKILSEEHKQKISESLKGEKNPFLGKHHSEKVKKQMSEARKGEKCYNFGQILSEEHKQKISDAQKGEKNHNWKGGISKSPYCKKWTEELREEIRERDNNVCQNCGKTEENNNRKLSVHHIHYDKENCYPDLITLCCSCNSKVNYNRLYWEYVFMGILTKRKLLNYFGDIK